MKKLVLLLMALGALLGAGSGTALAQEIVTTGTVLEMGKEGTMTVRSDQTNGPVTFYGVGMTNIFTVDGSPATMNDLQMGTKVTVQYAVRSGKWYVSKIMFGNAPKAGATAAAAAAPGAVMPMQKMIDRSGNTASPDGKSGGSTVAPVLTNKTP